MSSEALFADHRVDLATLRRRAHNFRWAEVEPDVIPLTAADSDFPIADVIREAIVDYVGAGYLSYGPARGLPEFRGAVAETLCRRRRIPCGAESVFAANSAASAMYLVARAVLQPGDEVLIPDPVDFLFERSVVAAGGVVRRFPIRMAGDHSVDPSEVAARIGPRTRMISVCNPHNPLGRVWTRDELATIVGLQVQMLAERLVDRRITLEVTDDAAAWLAERGYDPAYGARPLRRLIQTEIGDRLARRLLDGSVRDGSVVTVDVEGQQLSVR